MGSSGRPATSSWIVSLVTCRSEQSLGGRVGEVRPGVMWCTCYLGTWKVEAVGDPEFKASLCLSETQTQDTREGEEERKTEEKCYTSGALLSFPESC